MRVIELDEIRDHVPFHKVVAAVEQAFAALSRGDALLPPATIVQLPERHAEIHIKGAHLKGARYLVMKVATGFPENRSRGLNAGDGVFLLLDAETGAPEFVLAEHGYLTDVRTAAAVSLTLRYLAPKDAKHALLVGAGPVARLAARAIITERPIERLTIWNRTRERAEVLARELAGIVETRIAPALEFEVRDHRLIVSATASTAPLIRAAWVQAGTHVTSVGTGTPGKVELEPELLAKADKLVVDLLTQAEQYGNLYAALAAGVLTRERVYAELGTLAAGGVPGRQDAREITVADLTGVGVQDAAIAQVVLESLAP